MGAMLLAAAATYAADQIIDLSTPAAWTTRSVTAGKNFLCAELEIREKDKADIEPESMMHKVVTPL